MRCYRNLCTCMFRSTYVVLSLSLLSFQQHEVSEATKELQSEIQKLKQTVEEREEVKMFLYNIYVQIFNFCACAMVNEYLNTKKYSYMYM